MRYLALDTNTIMTCLLVRQHGHSVALLKRVLRYSRKCGATVLVPEVVEAELSRLLKGTEYVPVVFEFLGSEGVEVLPLTPAAMTRAMIWSISAAPPAKVSNSDQLLAFADVFGEVRFRYGAEQDCLILATLSEFMVDKRGDELVICSNDGRWYREGQLAESIREKFSGGVVGFRDLLVIMEELFAAEIAEELKAEFARMSQVFEKIREDLLAPVNEVTRQMALQLSAVTAAIQSQMVDLSGVTSQLGDAMKQHSIDAGLLVRRLYGEGSPFMSALNEINEANAATARLVLETVRAMGAAEQVDQIAEDEESDDKSDETEEDDEK